MQQLQKFETPAAVLGCFSKSRPLHARREPPGMEGATRSAADNTQSFYLSSDIAFFDSEMLQKC